MQPRLHRFWAIAAACAWACACTADLPKQPRALSTIAPAELHNRTTNGLNQVLIATTMRDKDLSASSLAPVLGADPMARKYLKYLLECALPPDATVTVNTPQGDFSFHGSIGLAPQWASGPCDDACQQWVSACLLARTNAFAVTVQIYMTGPHAALTIGDEFGQVPVEEGAFYGNIFDNPPREYACRGSGYDPLMQTFRVCSQPGDRCGYQYVGACGPMDGDTGQDAQAIACEPAPGKPYYETCYNIARSPTGRFQDPAVPYKAVMTIHLPKTAFSPPCGSALDPDAAKRPDPFANNLCPPDAASCAGQRCVNDAGCRSDLLTCSVHGPEAGYCSATCKNGNSSSEAEQCGGAGSTCLTFGSGATANSLCTKTCKPGAPLGSPNACAAWQICTGFWYTKPDTKPDNPGCAPKCRDDSDCEFLTFCNTRAAACGPPVNPSGLPDGEPCLVPAMGQVNPCKGLCFGVGPDPQHGICGSVIDAGKTKDCPDNPQAMYPVGVAGQDDWAMCIYRKCAGPKDCAAPLVCSNKNAATAICQFPSN